MGGPQVADGPIDRKINRVRLCFLQYSYHPNIATYYGAFVKKTAPGSEDQLWVRREPIGIEYGGFGM